MFKGEEIDFSKIADWEFEFICFELIERNGFEKVTWRKKGADSGRDIEAYLRILPPIIESYEEKWFFECKHYKDGVPPSVLNSKIAWADAEKPDHLVFLLSSHLTNSSREWIDKIREDKSYRIHVVEGEKIKKLIQKYPYLLSVYFTTGGLTKLLFETKKNWLTFNFLPSYDQLRLLIVRSDISQLKTEQLAFLICTYFIQYDMFKAYNQLRGLDNEFYFESLIPEIVKRADENELIFNPDTGPSLSKVSGFANDINNMEDHFFIAGESMFIERMKLPIGTDGKLFKWNKYEHGADDTIKEGLYLFYKIDEKKYLEISILKNSSFSTQISVIENMTNWSLMFLLWSLGYTEEFATKVFNKKFVVESNKENLEEE